MGTECCHVMQKYGRGWGKNVKCSRPAKMHHEGKPYCSIHDPVKRAAKRGKSHAEIQARTQGDVSMTTGTPESEFPETLSPEGLAKLHTSGTCADINVGDIVAMAARYCGTATRYCGVNEYRVESFIESAFWEMDARVKGDLCNKQSGRDAFKHVVRGVITRIIREAGNEL